MDRGKRRETTSTSVSLDRSYQEGWPLITIDRHRRLVGECLKRMQCRGSLCTSFHLNPKVTLNREAMRFVLCRDLSLYVGAECSA